jgi:mono/diheme cytochrome c family protein
MISPSIRRFVKYVSLAILLAVLAFAALVVRELMSSTEQKEAQPLTITPELIARGEYLAKIGNCAGCHTARGGEPFAGGRRIQTPFGSVAATNITPDPTHGIGNWSASDFYRALHEGRSKDSRLLSPAFPYTNTTLISRDDSDAMYAFLINRVAPSSRSNERGSLGFPYNSQIALAAWRVLFFKEAPAQQSAPTTAAERGAYLANGLAHCTACHGARNLLGAPIAGREYAGALMPLNDWYAPSLNNKMEASVADWPIEEIAALLQVGHTSKASALGPMADVVFKSTQFLRNDDARAMATYLKSLPVRDVASRSTAKNEKQTTSGRGAKLYETHCQSCHGASGEGKAGAFPALAGNRAVTMKRFENLIRITLEGGFAPATRGHPAPYGMTPFYHLLKDDEIVEVLTHIRSSWGNEATPVTPLDMANYRNAARATQ